MILAATAGLVLIAAAAGASATIAAGGNAASTAVVADEVAFPKKAAELRIFFVPRVSVSPMAFLSRQRGDYVGLTYTSSDRSYAELHAPRDGVNEMAFVGNPYCWAAYLCHKGKLLQLPRQCAVVIVDINLMPGLTAVQRKAWDEWLANLTRQSGAVAAVAAGGTAREFVAAGQAMHEGCPDLPLLFVPSRDSSVLWAFIRSAERLDREKREKMFIVTNQPDVAQQTAERNFQTYLFGQPADNPAGRVRALHAFKDLDRLQEALAAAVRRP